MRSEATSEHAVRLPRSTSGNEPQHLLATLLGDYWFRRSEALPSAALIRLLALFGVPEVGARQAMRRLTERGLLERHRTGRTTGYALPERSAHVIAVRLRGVLEFALRPPAWDGWWTVVTFSIPAADREVRHPLRARLQSLGFAVLHDAIWIAPADLTSEATAMLAELRVHDAFVFRSQQVPRPDNGRDIAEVFRLDTLATSYAMFVDRHARDNEAVLSNTDALIRRTKLMTDWLALRAADPNLPEPLLPVDWPRSEARATFVRAYEDLAAPATEGFRAAIAVSSPELAALATHHAVTP